MPVPYADSLESSFERGVPLARLLRCFDSTLGFGMTCIEFEVARALRLLVALTIGDSECVAFIYFDCSSEFTAVVFTWRCGFLAKSRDKSILCACFIGSCFD